jgi:hypothetical protein
VKKRATRLLSALAACAALLAISVATAQAAPEDFDFESVEASVSTGQAGAHPDFTTTFKLNGNPAELDEPENPAFTPQPRPWGTLKDLSVTTPPGLIGNPEAFPTCSAQELTTIFIADAFGPGKCPPDSQVGVVRFGGWGMMSNPPGWVGPLYNMPSPGGNIVARLGFIGAFYPVFINIMVDPQRDYSLVAKVSNAPAPAVITGSTVTLWGVPADPSHDALRFAPLGPFEAAECSIEEICPGSSSGLAPIPFMSSPTSCGSKELGFEARSYPGFSATPTTATLESPSEDPPISGCEKAPFDPLMSFAPTSRRAASPSGMDVELSIPQPGLENRDVLATAHLKKAVVTLPEGLTLNPSAADGLEGCSTKEIGLVSKSPIRFNAADPSCPPGSKVGTGEISTPVLSDPLKASLYVADQNDNPFDTLLSGYMVAQGQGATVKVAGKFDLDPKTGRILATFDNNPQAPFSELKLHFKGGPRGVLQTPEACGAYATEYELTPWSGNPPTTGTSSFTIDEGCDTGGFDPKLSAGSANPVAGAHAPFLLDISREDGEQNISALKVTLPQGELAKLAGVELCEGPAASSGDCPPDSKIGSVSAAVGAGSLPLWVPQPNKEPTALYLAGPYKEAPYSVIAKVPAQAGPFDLGDVVTRAALNVDPETAQVSAASDPLPQALQGVPVSYRRLHVAVDRPGFALNPTDCEQMSVGSAISSNKGAIANPSSRFQVGSCGDLGFSPRLAMRLFGKTNRGAHPRFRAILRMPAGGANIARASVSLPRAEFLDQANIRTICTRVQFKANACPKAAIYGHAEARTPLLDQPLSGPVYLRSSDNELPDLIADLHGQVHVVLVGRIDSQRGGIRTTFDAVPDAPVSKFSLTMQGGEKGLLVNSRELCAKPSRAKASFSGQNGKSRALRPALRAQCGGEARKGKGR